MWLILAGVAVILGFVFGDYVDLLWLLVIIVFVGFCLERHYDSKQEKMSEKNMLKQFMLKTSGKAAAIKYSKEYWALKTLDPSLSDRDILLNLRGNQQKLINIEKQSYRDRNYIVPECLDTAYAHTFRVTGFNMSTLCDAYLIAYCDLLNYSEDLQEKTALLVDKELKKNGIPESLIGY